MCPQTLNPQPYTHNLEDASAHSGLDYKVTSLTAGRGWEISQSEPGSVRYNKQSQSLDSEGQSKHDVVTEL